MTILALDASGQTAGAALIDDSRVIAEFNINCGLTHSRTLMPLVDYIVSITGFDLKTVDYIACASGPGSFTGLRIGAACAKGLAAGLGKPMVNVPTLDALAYNICKPEGFAAPILDARRGEVYAAFYRFDGTSITRVSDYMAEPVEIIMERARGLDGSVTFLGDGVPPHSGLLLQNGFQLAPAHTALQRAASVGLLALELAREGQTVAPRDFKLMYIRKPQAERELEARNRDNASAGIGI